MSYAVATFTGNGVNTQFTVPFPLIDREHLTVFVGGISTSFSWIADGIINISPAPGNGVAVELRRDSNRSAPLVDFHDGAVLTEADLELANKQAIFVAQEAFDAADESVQSAQIEAWATTAQNSATAASASAAAASASAGAASSSASAAAASAIDAANSASLAGTKVDKLVANSAGTAFRLTTDANSTYDLETSTLAAVFNHVPASAIAGTTGKYIVVNRIKATWQGISSSYHAIAKADITASASSTGVFEAVGYDLKYTMNPANINGDFYGHRVRFSGAGANNAFGFVAEYDGTDVWDVDAAFKAHFANSAAVGRVLQVTGDGSGTSISRGIQFENTVNFASAVIEWKRSAGSAAEFINLADSSGVSKWTVGNTGDMQWWGNGQRIKGTFSDVTTWANNTLFQTRSANSATHVGAIPSGSGVISSFTAYGGSDPDATHNLSFGINSTEAFINASKIGAGVARDLKMLMDSVEYFRLNTAGKLLLGPVPSTALDARVTVGHPTAGTPANTGTTDPATAFRIDVSNIGVDFGVYGTGVAWIQPRLKTALGSNYGLALCPNGGTVVTGAGLNVTGNIEALGSARKILGDMSVAGNNNRLAVQNSVTNGNSILAVMPNGTSIVSALRLFGSSDPDGAAAQITATLGVNIAAGYLTIACAPTGGATQADIVLQPNNVNALVGFTNGDVSVGAGVSGTAGTTGFAYIPSVAGTPTGVPTARTGYAPMVWNSTGNTLHVYSGGAWRTV